MSEGDRASVFYCPGCDQDKDTRVVEHQEVYSVRGEDISIGTEVRICNRCDTPISDEQLDEVTIQKAYDEYRRKHKMLFPGDICETRERYGLSQRGMAVLLNWSPNTVARYETGALPDSAHMATLIMLRDNIDFARQLFVRAKDKLGRLDKKRLEETLSGVRPDSGLDLGKVLSERYRIVNPECLGLSEFNLDKLSNTVLFFSHAQPRISKTKMMKSLFYTDFAHYKKHGHSVTGTPYEHLPYGPVPYNHGLLLDYLVENGFVSVMPFENFDGEYLVPYEKPDLSGFDEEELDTMEQVLERFRSYNAKDISEYSHQEEAYIATKERELIPYRYGDKLKNF